MKLQTVSIGQSVEVSTHDFLRVEWTCPSCRASHNKDVFNGKHLCRCGEVIAKDAKTGEWRTPEGIPLHTTERPRTEQFSWQCPQCRHLNEKMNFPTAEDDHFVIDPQGGFNKYSGIGHRRHEPESGHLTCWACGLAVENSDGEWVIVGGVKE